MRNAAITSILIFLFILVGCSSEEPKQTIDVTKLGGEYLGESFPYGEAEIFVDGLIEDKYSLQNVVFAPDGNEFFFTRTTVDNDSAAIFSSKLINDSWTKPEKLSFIDEYSYTDPFVTYDNEKLFFTSDRPTPREGEHYFDFNIWYSERTESGWSEPEFISEINSMEDEYFPSLTEDGTIYFSSARDGSEGFWDIYKSEFIEGKFTAPVRLNQPINTEAREWDPFISRSGNEIYFSAERNNGFGGGDIYYSKKVNGSWIEPVNIGVKVNTNDFEYCPRISYDSTFLFFTRNLANEENFYQEKGSDTRDPFDYDFLPEAGVSRVYWIMIDSLKTITH